MGMFDKDKEIGTIITSWIPYHTPFVLWDARVLREDFPTKLGPAVQTEMVVSRIETPGDRYNVTSLASAIAGKVREAEPSDFPAVVQTAQVPSSTYGGQALVLQFLKPWISPHRIKEDSAPDPSQPQHPSAPDSTLSPAERVFTAAHRPSDDISF